MSLLVGRTLGFQLLTAGVTVVLARLLTPADYGLFAIALAVQLVGQNVAELGLPSALVRMPTAPSTKLQASTIGFLLIVTLTIAAVAIATAFVILPATGSSGDVAPVVAVTLLALPIYAVRAVPMAMMDREMRFGRVAAVEAADTVGFNVFALSAALAGLGVFSLAAAVPVGALLGATVAWSTQDAARLPRFELSRVKPLIGFGSRVSVLGILYLGRDLGYVVLVGAIGGAPMAGFYGMAKRLFSFPTALAAAVARVMLPTLSQSGEQGPERASRLLGQVGIVCGLPLALIAGAIQPFIDVVLGPEWLPASDIVLFGALSMMLVVSLAMPVNSLYLAQGKPNTPVLAVAVELFVGLLLLAILVDGLDETGIGIAMSASAVVSVAILLAAADSMVRSGVGSVARITAVTALAAAAGQLLPVSYDVVGLLASLCASAIVWLALAAVFLNSEVRQVMGMIRRLTKRGR